MHCQLYTGRDFMNKAEPLIMQDKRYAVWVFYINA